MLPDPSVRSVLVNVFGGITAFYAVANGIVSAFGMLTERGGQMDRPIVVRLDGNNAAEGRRILQEAFQEDPETDAIVMIGEIDGDATERTGAFIEQHVTKPVVGYVVRYQGGNNASHTVVIGIVKAYTTPSARGPSPPNSATTVPRQLVGGHLQGPNTGGMGAYSPLPWPR